MSAEEFDSDWQSPRCQADAERLSFARAGAGEARTASMLPLVILYQLAWDLAQHTDLSLSRLQHAAEAVALADAVLYLLADAGDQEGHDRWTVRFSEARHWCEVVRDSLTEREENAL